MATHRKKVVEVEARKYMGPASLSVVHDVKGQQTAKKGDWLLGSEKGKIEVVSDLDFQRDYEPIGDESGVDREYSLGTTVPAAIHPALKTIDEEPPLHDATFIGGETQDGVPVADATLDENVDTTETATPTQE